MIGGQPIVVARQPGTASAFVPVVEHLARVGPTPTVFAYPLAAPILQDSGIEALEVRCFDDATTAGIRFESSPFVLTGTSVQAADDARWWQAARLAGVPSIGYLDSWVNYWQRFSFDVTGAPRIDALPDRVAVVDERARDRLVGHGVPERSVVVTGSPLLDLLALPADAVAARRSVGASTDDVLVLLASEPEARVVTGRDPVDWPAGVLAAIETVVAALAGRGPDAVLAVKLHPRERVPGYLGVPPGAEGVRVVVVASDIPGLLQASDVVVGLQSMVLYEASVLRKPAVSIRIGDREPNDVTDRDGIVNATTRDEAIRAVADAVGRRGPHRPFAGGAAARFVEALGLA